MGNGQPSLILITLVVVPLAAGFILSALLSDWRWSVCGFAAAMVIAAIGIAIEKKRGDDD